MPAANQLVAFLATPSRTSHSWSALDLAHEICHTRRAQQGSTMPDEDTKAEIERLRNENAALKKGASTGIRMKVSEKGAVSI
jgi:hypothetical protein